MFSLAIHGGAGALPARTLSAEREAAFHNGLARALGVAQAILDADGRAIDAVEEAVAVLEDDPLFNAGRGAVLTMDGTVELDASIMDGEQLRAGAVAAVRHVRNPIRLARRVLEDTPHVFLVGEGADRFAEQAGVMLVANEYFITPDRLQQLEALRWHLKQTGAALRHSGCGGTRSRRAPRGRHLNRRHER